MPSPHRSFAAAVVTICSAFLPVPAAAQEADRGWTLTAGGGYGTQLDPGSSKRGSLSFGASALRSLTRTVSLGVEGGYDRHEAFEEGGEVWWNGPNVTSSECPGPCTWQRCPAHDRGSLDRRGFVEERDGWQRKNAPPHAHAEPAFSDAGCNGLARPITAELQRGSVDRATGPRLTKDDEGHGGARVSWHGRGAAEPLRALARV
jgi:hypothetical protein